MSLVGIRGVSGKGNHMNIGSEPRFMLCPRSRGWSDYHSLLDHEKTSDFILSLWRVLSKGVTCFTNMAILDAYWGIDYKREH